MKPSPEAVHDALRRWHTGGYDLPPWNEMLVVAQHLTEQAAPDLDLAVKKVLLAACRRGNHGFPSIGRV